MKSLASPTFTTGYLVLMTAFGLSAADWPQWRGPSRDAVNRETGLLKEWPADGPKLLWEAKGLGRGYSSVAMVGNRLFTMGDLDEAQGKAQFVVALDLTTHEVIWKTRVGAPHGDGSRCTPTVHDGLVYALGTEGDLVCLQADSGKEVWRKSLVADLGGKMMSGWKYSESPLVDGDKVICTPGGSDAALAALNRKTGEVIWKCAPPASTQMGGAGYASVVVSSGAGVRQYVTVMGRGALGVDAATGKFLWHYPRVANGTANIPTPVTEGDFVFVSTGYGTGSALLKLVKEGDGIKAEEVYWLKANTFQCHHGGFLKLGDYIFGAHGHNAGNPICLEMATGKVMWSEKQPGERSGAVVCADNKLIYRYENNVVALIEANPREYQLKSTFKLPGRPGMGGPGWAHPVVLDGRLYLRHNDYLFCYDIKNK
jgi:outer membrane protein assembly factor BamB